MAGLSLVGEGMERIDEVLNKYLMKNECHDITDSMCSGMKDVFGNFYKGFLSYCEREIKNKIMKFQFKYSIKVKEEIIVPSILKSVIEGISDLAARTLIVELNYLKSNNLLSGNDSKERYDFFNEKLLNQEYIKEIFSKYPVLLILIDEKIEAVIKLLEEILEALGQDRKEIESEFKVDASILTSINISSGDSHNGGRKVTILQFGDKYVVYKPHGLTPEKLFNKVIQYVNEKSVFKYELKKLQCIDCITYGWQEFGVYGQAENKEDIDKFYYRMGAFLSVFYMFSCSDLHNENVLACKDTPAIFDLETLVNIFQQSLGGETILQQINSEICSSVLGTMLLPINIVNGCFDYDLSGMSGGDERASKKWFYFNLENIGTDNIAFEKKPCKSPKAKNSLMFEGKAVSPKLNYSNIKDGFKECYIILKDNKEDILNIIFKNKIVIRHVLRPTAVYARFLEASTYPKYLVSMKSRRDLFSKLYLNSSNDSVVECEINALMKHDVPYFSAYIDSLDIVGNKNRVISNYFIKSAYDIIVDKIQTFSKKDLNKQIYYIGQSLSTMEGSVNNYLYNYKLDAKKTYLENAKVLADEIYDFLIFNAKKDEASFFMTFKLEDGKKVIDGIDCNLYSGGGVILLLAALGYELKEEKYIGLSKKLLDYQLSRPDDIKYLSAFSGIGSKIYICYNFFKIFKDEFYYNKALEMVEKIFLNENASKDFVTGIAGLIVMLLNIYEKEKNDIWLEKAELLGQDLYSYIFNGKYKLLTGLAHGLSGYSWALIRLGKIINKEEYVSLGVELIKKENNYYTALEHNWIDLRDDGEYISYWCYGAAGISLSRLKIGEIISNSVLEEDLLNGVKSIREYKCKSHCICHGTFGNIDILLEIGKLKNEDCLVHFSEDRAKKTLNSIEEDGVVLGDDSYLVDYSFMQGVTGIAYSLLRLSNNAYPCIVSLDVM